MNPILFPSVTGFKQLGTCVPFIAAVTFTDIQPTVMRIFSFFVYKNGLVIEGRETGKKEVKMKAGCFLPLRGVNEIKKAIKLKQMTEKLILK